MNRKLLIPMSQPPPVLEFWHLPILRQVSIRTISSSFHKSVPGVGGAGVGLSSLLGKRDTLVGDVSISLTHPVSLG